MSNLNEAFKIPLLASNYEFVTHPYIPIPTITYPKKPDDRYGYVKAIPSSMTVARCFDVQVGAKHCYWPSYPEWRCNAFKTA